MTAASIRIREADAAALDRVESLLAEAGLPSRDVRSGRGRFFLADAGGAVIGVGGLELYGSEGLLRSVAVTEPNRGQGYGTALVAALEERARSNGCRRLYLLTTTATEFFRARGYSAIVRESVPASIRTTTEFRQLCPEAATCLKTELG